MKNHTHTVSYVEKRSDNLYYPVEGKDYLNFTGPFSAVGRINNLALSGEFFVSVDFSEEELREWLNVFVESDPAPAAKVLAEFQLKAANLICKQNA